MNTSDKSRDIALLVIAFLLIIVYLVKEFYLIKNSEGTLSVTALQKQSVMEVEDTDGNAKVYLLPEEDTQSKNGAKIKINNDGTVSSGLMTGEKHLVFNMPLDINKATQQDFEALPGIGPSLAKEIIESRNKIGGFITIDDMKKVKGVGEKKFEKLKHYLAVK